MFIQYIRQQMGRETLYFYSDGPEASKTTWCSIQRVYYLNT